MVPGRKGESCGQPATQMQSRKASVPEPSADASVFCVWLLVTWTFSVSCANMQATVVWVWSGPHCGCRSFSLTDKNPFKDWWGFISPLSGRWLLQYCILSCFCFCCLTSSVRLCQAAILYYCFWIWVHVRILDSGLWTSLRLCGFELCDVFWGQRASKGFSVRLWIFGLFKGIIMCLVDLAALFKASLTLVRPSHPLGLWPFLPARWLCLYLLYAFKHICPQTSLVWMCGSDL